jgi:flagellar hook assembly protein FlgD
MRELPLGEYEAKIRVWDVANNPSEARTKFIIAENAELALTQILNYPNPFSTHTEFFIGHNQVGKDLYAQIKIFTISGKLVKVLASDFYGEGNYFRGLDWDGLDEYGDRIGRGTYVYQVTLKERSSGKSVSKFEKMVLLR